MALRIPILTKENIRVTLDAIFASGAQVDPTGAGGATVQMAFKTTGQPSGGDWKSAAFETNTTETPTVYEVRCLVGGTGTGATAELAVGSYTMWVKVTGSPEIPVFEAGRLEVFS